MTLMRRHENSAHSSTPDSGYACPARLHPRDTARAMSQENLQIIRDWTAALNRGDLDAWSEAWADDVDYRAVEGAPDDHGPIRGKAAMRAYVQDWIDTFDQFKVEPLEVIDAGQDRVVAVLRISGRAKLSGVETELTFAALYTVRDEKVVRGREYWTRDEALEAAGLAE
jgi:ketosteroid isomerase-like protein